MKVTAFNGSPRGDGNTALLVNHVFSDLEKEDIDTELVQLAGKSTNLFFLKYSLQLRMRKRIFKQLIGNVLMALCIRMTIHGLITGNPPFA